ncbi:MAG TPA: hypothetical protein VF544_14095 [Pyrinomonadaceae bacterium]|jgi:hypothetical protein
MGATVKKGAIERTNALAELGLSEKIVREVILDGEAARNSCTANDAPCIPGIIAWGRSVRSLRDNLIPKGWEKNNEDNFPTVVSPNGKIAIAVATGDEGTGQEKANPKTKYPKGVAAEEAINRNLNSLFAEVRAAAQAEKDKRSNRQTWILLKHREKDTVFSELSLPASMTKDEQVKNWLTRIILEPIKTDPNVEVQDDSTAEPIDVPVRRRS